MKRILFLAAALAGWTVIGPARAATYPTTNFMTELPGLPDPAVSNNEEYGHASAFVGDTAVMTAPAEGGSWQGAIYVFSRTNGVWAPPSRLVPGTNAFQAYFGASVALDGDTLVVGAPGRFTSSARGAVHVFQRTETNWVPTQRLSPEELTANDRFGAALSLDGDTLLVGAPHGGGRAYVFTFDGAQWVQQQRLDAPGSPSTTTFASAVVLDGDTAFIGDSTARTVHIYGREGGNWTRRTALTAQGGTGAGFGSSVALGGGRLLVGASGENASYVFTGAGTNWARTARLASGGGAGVVTDRFILMPGDFPGTLIGYSLDGDLEMALLQGGAYSGVLEHEWMSYASIATSGGEVLVGAMGTATDGDFAESRFVAVDPRHPDHLAAMVRGRLYPESGHDAGPFSRSAAAFRYRQQLYQMTNSSVRPRFDVVGDYYGDAERARVAEATDAVTRGLAENATNLTLQSLLLDLLYDESVAEAVAFEDARALAEKARFGPPISSPAPAGGFLVDNEISLSRTAERLGRKTTAHYLAALAGEAGPGARPQTALEVFRERVPFRSQKPASFLDGDGNPVSTTTDATPLLSGYQDLIHLLERLREQGRVAADLCRLLIGRDGAGDRDEAAALLTATESRVFLEGNMLVSLFPESAPEGAAGLALANAREGWATALSDLGHLRSVLAGKARVLGFDDGFLMFVQSFPGQSGDVFDSYDALQQWLDPEADQTNPLKAAVGALADAVAGYETYRESLDSVEAEFSASSITYEDRLRDIVGVFPGDPSYSDDPAAHPGSELDQQFRSIEVARLRIRRNRAEIANVKKAVEIELQRKTGVTGAILKYGNKQAELTRIIGHIEAAQAFADSLSGALSVENLTKKLFGGFLLNGIVQAGGEEAKGQLNARKEELAAAEQATIEGIDSAAAVKTMMLQLNTLAVDSLEAAVLLQQEVNLLSGLYREKADLERKMAEREAGVARRYFADPSHRIRSQAAMIRANRAFDEARKWVFFMVRALDYKWNTRWSQDYLGTVWNASSIFKVRNAEELRGLYEAMTFWEANNQLAKSDRLSLFSIREDYFGYRMNDVNGQPAVYADPVTGESVGAVQAFRSRLRQLVDVDGVVQLRFSTVREDKNELFFTGPTYNSSGVLTSGGEFVDKIHWMIINIPGQHTVSDDKVTVELAYAGSSFIRNRTPGAMDPERPDRLVNELTAYSTRYWFFDGAKWRFKDAYSAPVSALLGATLDPSCGDALPSGSPHIPFFKERSVAATDWRMSIPTTRSGEALVKIDEMDDVVVYFCHRAIPRQ